MEEEDDDVALLTNLGILSANSEDIERKILSKENNDVKVESPSQEDSGRQELDGENKTNSLFDRKVKLYNRLRAVEVEIDAVASTIDNTKCAGKRVECGTLDNSSMDKKDSNGDALQVTSNGLSLQQALAKDRLRSLRKTKFDIQKDISSFVDRFPTDEVGHMALIDELVEEKLKKRRPKDVKNSIKKSKRIVKYVAYEEDTDFDSVLDTAGAGLVETERDKFVRKGILTPFHKLKGFERCVQQPESSNRQKTPDNNHASSSINKVVQSMSEIAQARPTTKLLDAESLPGMDVPTRPFHRLKTPLKRPRSPSTEKKLKKERTHKKTTRPLPDKKWRKPDKTLTDGIDDDETVNLDASDREANLRDAENSEGTMQFVMLEGGLKIPCSMYNKLFDYQRVGVQWMWELHCQRAGGIIGDEMGLGKTIQVISFLGALHFSKMYKPSIVVCPVTLLRQWQREVLKWYPKFKVAILHDSAHVREKKAISRFDEADNESEISWDSDNERLSTSRSSERWNEFIDRTVRLESGLLLTTYEQLRLLGDKLLDVKWGYAVLDEGHRIRNPNAEVTLVCKQLQTVHRIIMTGAPIQNKLSELWSLFDFVFPGKLGVLPVFEMEFAVPIAVGGYANATPLQVSTAYRCAVILRDLIMPYLLRRMKADVNAPLTKKTEHVLFCSLTENQRSAYRAFLASSEVEQIFDGRRNSLYGIDVMRKICNHPDLLEREHTYQHPDYGNQERSGKMMVVSQVLRVWKEQGHRVLLFSQTQKMLDIIENFLLAIGYSYRRMDGFTPVKQRMALIDEFNNTDDVYIFILTTKVGGLGTNLTGADRVIIYDPDWNPSTDMQARERAWRIGQKRDVTVYRLITRGTIEEKVYHRQIYKHFLTNKILKNPQQKRFFKARDMRDLFTLQDDREDKATETSSIFSQLVEDVQVGLGNDGQIGPSSLAPGSSGIERHSLGIKGMETTDQVSCGGSSPAASTVGAETADQISHEVDDETDILKSLFVAHGIHSALNHDAIINANDEDKLRLEEQASQVARRAAEALRESRMLRSRESFAIPTWTGKAGAAGAPSPVHKKFGSTLNAQFTSSSKTSSASPNRHPAFAAGTSSGKALSSAELLARIRGNQEGAAADALHQDLNLASSSNHRSNASEKNRAHKSSSKLIALQPEVLIRQLCTFMQQRGGQADSASITQHFKDRIQSKDLSLFKNLLKEIATLEKSPDGSRWVLKADYRQ